MYLFELGREYKLSLAEIFSFFHQYQIIYLCDKVLILDKINGKDIFDFAKRSGGSIKIGKIEKKFLKSVKLSEINEYLGEDIRENGKGKIDFGVNLYGEKSFDTKKLLLDMKKRLKEESLSTRFVNQNFLNLSSAIIIGEKLVQKGMDFNIIATRHEILVGKTIWVQDIEAYSKRDYGKARDMEVGMLPPKLAQIMINIAIGYKKESAIYDPFCGLGTVLIESVLSGNRYVYGSDIKEAMVEATNKNLFFIKKTFDLQNFKSEIFLLDAKSIEYSPAFKNAKIDAIVTEGYLGNIFTHSNISEENIESERKKLSLIYENFFFGLKKISFKGPIVISFPFWEIRKKYIYFSEIYSIINKYCLVEKLLPDHQLAKESKSGSLLYKRANQLVGREIFKLLMK